MSEPSEQRDSAYERGRADERTAVVRYIDTAFTPQDSWGARRDAIRFGIERGDHLEKRVKEAPMASDRVEIATSGTVPRQDQCVRCTGPMVYRTVGEKIVSMFCGDMLCEAYLREILENAD